MTYKNLCHDCGTREYVVVRPNFLRGITVSIGTCDDCGEEAGIIPAEDWRNACRTDREPKTEEID